jgi:hypothetical protein
MYSTLKNSWEVKQDIYEAFCTEMDKEDSANDDRLDYLQDQLSIASGKFSEYVDIAINDDLMTALDIIHAVQKWTESRMRKTFLENNLANSC